MSFLMGNVRLAGAGGTKLTQTSANGTIQESTITPTDIITATGTATLTNKTMSGASNTFTGIDHLTALTNVGTNTHAQIDTHIAATVAHGATGAVVGTTNTQTLTNKTIDSAGNTVQVSGTNVNSLINQDVRSTASPTFNNTTVTTLTTTASAGTPGDITMPAATKNRKIVLYPSSSNDHQFYGLGVNGNVLRFQADQTATNFIFYAATSSTASNEVFRVLGTGGVQFTNSASGYTPSTLSYYEEGSFTANFTGAATTSQTIRFTRVGNKVILQVPAFTATFSSSAPLTAGAAIPARLRPTTGDTISYAIVIQNGSQQAANTYFRARTTGDLILYGTPAGANFSGPGDLGTPFVQTMTYVV